MKPEESKLKKVEREIEEYVHKPIAKELLLIVVLLALIAYSLFAGPKLIGFFAAGETNTYADKINEKFTENYEYNWTLQNVPAGDFQLTSVKLSGAVTGNAKVYLVTDSGRLLIFDSLNLKTGTSPLTAFAAAEETSSSSSDESSSGSVDSQDTAQPEPPSSGDSSSPESPSVETDTTSGSGAENSAPEGEQLPPAEDIPAEQPSENQTQELPPENITTSEENITLPEENVTTPENITENQTIEIPLAEEIPFENACIDTCYIPEMLNKSSYMLQIEVESSTILKLDFITYELFISKENLTNVTNETVFFATGIEDAKNNTITATIEFVDPQTEEIEAVGKSEEGEKSVEETFATPLFQGAAVVEEQPGEAGLDIPKGKYDIKVKPKDNPVKEIVFNNIEIQDNITEFIKLDDVPENVTNLSDVVETYAIDPTAFIFTSATVTAIAKGNTLLKCKDWDFTNRECLGGWITIQSIIPGEPYTFTLTPEDPAYSETLQPSDIDAAVRSFTPNGNYGTDTFVRVQTYSSANTRTFLRFNLSSIPSDATILSANVSLYRYDIGTFAARTYNIRRVNASWTEAGITWNNQPAVNAVTSSASVGATINTWYAWDVTSDVKGFVNGSYANYGWRISDSVESSGTAYTSDFYSNNYATNTSRRPKLDVYYLVDTPPNSTLVSPANGNITANNNASFACNATDDFNLANMTFYWNYTGSWLANGTTAISGVSNQTSFNRTDLNNGAILWNCQSCDNASQCAFAPANWTVTVNYTISDTQAPQWSNNQSSYPAKYNVSQPTIFNITWTDNVNVSAVLIEGNWSGSPTNYSMNLISGTTANGIWNYSTAPLAAGTYYWKSHANDTSSSWNSTTSFVFTINKADNSADLYLNSNKNQNVTIIYPAQSNATGTAFVGAASLFRDGSPVSNSEVATLAVNIAGYNYTVTTAGDANYSANSTTYYLFVNKQPTAVDLYLNGTQNNLTITYGAQTNVTAIGTNGTVTLYKNGSIISSPEIAILTVGYYNYTAVIPDDANRTGSSKTFFLAVNQASTFVNMSLNGVENNITITYPQTITAIFSTDVLSATMYRNGTNVTAENNSAVTLAAGYYNYTVINLGDTNYTASSKTFFLIVSKQPTAVDMYINGNLNQNVTITYGTQSNVTAIGTNGTVTLYENGSDLGNPRIATLAAGTYNFTAIIPDDVNKTGSSRTYFLTVSPAASQVSLLLDGANANKTIEVGSTVNLTATLIIPSTGVVQLYRADSLIQSGSAPITNLSTFSTLGTFNITEIYPATQNYSSISQIYYVITQDTTPPNVYLTSPGNNTAIKVQTQGFTFNATDNYFSTLNCTLYINNIASGTNASVVVNTPTIITNTTIPEGNNPWHVNCTDGSSNTGQSETRVLTVDLTPPVITHIRPVQNDIVGYNVTLDVDIADNLVGVASAWYEISNSSGIQKTGTLPGPAYQDVWNSKTVQDGNYTFRAYANDTLGNQANSSVNFTVDNTAPFIQILKPLNDSKWNINFNLNVTIQNTRINASAYNITNSTGAVVQSNSNNAINSPTFAWTDLVNVNSLPSGTYVISVYALDSIGYATVENSTFIIDKLAPQYSILVASPASPTIYSPTQAYEFNATWIDNFAVSAVIFEFNGTNYTDATQSGNVYSKTFVGLNVGSYNYKWYANDTTGNWNSTGTFTYVINKAPTTTSLYLNGARANAAITYTTQSNATAITSVGVVTLYRNGTNVGTSEITTLAVGYYNYTAINTGDSNYLPSSETWWLTVNKQATAVDLYLNSIQANLTVTYPTQTNVTAIGYNGSATLYKNGSIISSPEITTLAAGYYNYTAAIAGDANHTGSSKTFFLTVGKQPTETKLYLNGTRSDLAVTYGIQTNVTAVFTNKTGKLYKNDIEISNPDIGIFAAGIYNYSAIIESDENKTGSSENWTLTIGKQPTAVDLYLNGSQNNLTITYSTQSNVTAIGYNGSVALYRNGTNVGTSEITTLAAGTYNYTAAVIDDANHTGSSKTFFVTVNKLTPTLNLLIDGNAADKSVTYPIQTNATAFESNTGDSDVSYTLYRNSNSIGSGSLISDVQTLGVNTYVYTYNTTGGANYTSNTINRTLTVGIQPTAVDLYLNEAQNNLTITYGTQSNATAIGYNGTITLYRNGTNVGTQEITTLPVGYYNYTASIPDDANHTGSSKTFFLTVNIAQTSVNLSLNGAENNLTITYPQTVTAVFSTNVLSATMYRNGTNISSENNSAVTLAAGYYNYTVINSGDANHTASSKTFFVTVNKQSTAVDLFLNGTQSDLNITYGITSNATAIGYNDSVTLYRDGTPVSNPEIAVLPYGYYNYTALIPDTVNKTGSSKTYFLTVEKQNTETKLYLNGDRSNLSVTHGTQTNATAEFTNKTGKLYRNGIEISNPNIGILGVGVYNYSAVIDSDVNKTGSSENWTLTVTKAAGNITLLLNGTNGDFDVNRSQTVNITGIRTTGDGNMQLYDNGVLINTGAPAITNITSYSALGSRNITLIFPETQNYTAATSTHFLSVYGILSAYVTIPTGTPKYYEGQNITFKGYVYDDLASPIDGATVTFEPINGSYTYICSSTLGEGGGLYNCTQDTTGMTAPRIYNVQINATKAYYHLGTYTNSSVFLLESGQKANLLLHKIPNVQAINSSQITYNISLHLANGRGTSDNTTLADPDAGQNWSIGSIYGAQEVIESYLLTYNRGSVDSLITLQKANATGYDPTYNMSLFVESNQPVIVIPQNITAAQLTLIKNVAFVNQTTTNITYLITDQVVNSGGEDLTGISIVDSDISLTTFANLTRGSSITFNGTKLIAKSSQSYTFNFTQATASANAIFYYSNQPSVQIPGYGGPYDVIIDSLPSSVVAGDTITGVVKAINMNSEISEDRVLTTWIEDSFGNITALDVRTIFVGRNQSATASITLTVPLTPGTYLFVSKLTWPTADANASKAFTVTSAVIPPVAPPAAAPAAGVPVNITVPVLPPGVPQDIIDSLIELKNVYKELSLKTEDLNNILKAAEDAAARGNYDLARNLLKSAYGMVQEIQLEICGKALPSAGFALPAIDIAQFFNIRWLWWILATTVTVIFITALIVKRREDMAIEAELLSEERTHLEKLYDKVSDYLNRKITKGDKG